ncbi:MAG: TM2 domain-containing protein [Muribaculaceae bacterium]|nr:TM2 domain-containing protein [Muribaculaceae bacterium]
MKQCPKCHQYVDDYSTFCNHCGYSFGEGAANGATPPPVNEPYATDNAFDACGPEGKSRGVAALLAIILGGLGIQYFYLGKVGAGVITICLTLVTCGLWEIVTLIQGILMFCMTNAQFRQKYVTNPATFPLF